MASPQEQQLRANIRQIQKNAAAEGRGVSQSEQESIRASESRIQTIRTTPSVRERGLVQSFRGGQAESLTSKQAVKLGFSPAQIAIGEGRPEGFAQRQAEFAGRRAVERQRAEQFVAQQQQVYGGEIKSVREKPPLLVRLGREERGQAPAGALTLRGRELTPEQRARPLPSVIPQQAPVITTGRGGVKPSPPVQQPTGTYFAGFIERPRVDQPIPTPQPVVQPTPSGVIRAASPEEIRARRGAQLFALPKALVSGAVRGGALGETIPEQVEGQLEETGAEKTARILGTGVTTAALFATGVGGVRGKAIRGVSRIAKLLGYGKKATKVAVVVEKVVPVVEKVVPVVEKVAPVAERVSPRVAQVVERLTPSVAKQVTKVAKQVVPKVAKVAVAVKKPAISILDRGLVAAPQALGEVALGQVALKKYVSVVQEKLGEEAVKGAQEAQALVLARRGQEEPIGFRGEVTAEPTFKGAVKATGRTLQYGFVGNLPLGQQFLRFVSPSFRAEEERAYRDVGTSRGLSGDELDAFVRRARLAGNLLQTGEAVTTVVGVERVTERLGLKTIGTSFATREGTQLARKEVAKKLFGLTAPRFAVAGAIEGVAQFETQLKTRGGERTAKGLLVSGAGGAFISTVLGGGAVAFAATRPTLSKAFSFTGQALEFPFEKTGDIVAAGQVSILRRLGVEVVSPALKPVFRKEVQKEIKAGTRVVASEAAEKFELLVYGRKVSGRIKPRVTVPSFAGGQPVPSLQVPATVSQTQANVQTASENIAKSLGVEVPVKAKAKVQVPKPRTPTPVSPTQPVKTPAESVVENLQKTPVETPAETPVEPTVTTPVETLAQFNIPIQTNVFGLRGLLPPAPLPFPLGNGGGGRGLSGKVFRNELLASQQLFRQQVKFGIKTLTQPVGKKPKMVKKSVAKKQRESLSKQLSDRLSALTGRGR